MLRLAPIADPSGNGFRVHRVAAPMRRLWLIDAAGVGPLTVKVSTPIDESSSAACRITSTSRPTTRRRSGASARSPTIAVEPFVLLDAMRSHPSGRGRRSRHESARAGKITGSGMARYTCSTMFARRRFVGCRTVALIVLSLLFSQLTLAAYVCPAKADPASMSETMTAAMPCQGADAAQPGLCHQHAADAARLFELAQAASPSLPAVIQVLLIPASPDLNDAAAMPPAAVAEVRPPPDPIFLSTLRLRV